MEKSLRAFFDRIFRIPEIRSHKQDRKEKNVIIALKQELLDPQMALAVGRCVRCGAEIYSRETWRELEGKCPECARSDAAPQASEEADEAEDAEGGSL